MVGQEWTVLPLLAKQTFALTAFTASATFIIAFGATKALIESAAVAIADPIAA